MHDILAAFSPAYLWLFITVTVQCQKKFNIYKIL